MTNTTTERDALNIDRGTLVLVTLDETYARSWQGPVAGRDRDTTAEERTYYATRHDDGRVAPDYVTLVVPESDPRSADMWSLRPERYGLTLDSPHRGWDVLKSNLTPVVDEARPFAVGDRVKISDTHPAGASWQGHTGVVVSLGHHISVRMETGPYVGSTGEFRPELLTRVAEDSPEATTGPETGAEESGRTFSQEDVDRLVREAREAERRDAEQRFETWKERASEIACRYADDNSLCSEFEQCMEEIGLKGRSHDYVVSLTVTVTARNEEHAYGVAAEEIYNMSHYTLQQNMSEPEEI